MKVRPAVVLGCDIAEEDRVLVAVVYHTTAFQIVNALNTRRFVGLWHRHTTNLPEKEASDTLRL
jgi:hypothetical protein